MYLEDDFIFVRTKVHRILEGEVDKKMAEIFHLIGGHFSFGTIM